jgi:uncharacterized protein YkwD
MTGVSLYLATLLLGTHFPGQAVTPAVPPTPLAIVMQAQLSSGEQRMVDLVNAERLAKGLGILKVNPLLVQVAREHSREMCEKGYFDHMSPTPGQGSPMQRYIRALGRMPAWACLSENLFYSSIIDPDLGHKCLMRSAPHKRNILTPEFNEIGVGVYESPDGKFWVTQMFLSQID